MHTNKSTTSFMSRCLIATLTALFVFGISACSSSDDDGGGNTKITSAEQVAAVASLALLTGSIAGDTSPPPVPAAPGLSIQNGLEIVLPGFNQALNAARSGDTTALASVMRAPVSSSEPCTGGGMISVSGDDGATSGNGDVTYTYTDCVEDTSTINGTVRMEYVYPETMPFTLTLNITVSDPSEGTNVTFSNFSVDLRTTTLAGATDLNPIAITLDGSMSVSSPDGSGSGSVRFSSYQIKAGSNATGSVSAINGTFTFEFTPNICGEGTYTFVTNTPLQYDMYVGYYTAGKITINGNTTIVFNGDGSVTVTVSGATTNYASNDAFQAAGFSCRA